MGTCAGCPRPLPEFELLLELELAPEDCDDWAEDPPFEAAWPWKDLAAAIEMTPVRPTAPAISHRLIREIRASPASRVLVARGLTYPMIGRTRKKMLNRM